MIVAENAPIDFQGAFVGLLGQSPLLFAHVYLCEIIRAGRDIGGCCVGIFQDCQAAVVQLLGVDESVFAGSAAAPEPTASVR